MNEARPAGLFDLDSSMGNGMESFQSRPVASEARISEEEMLRHFPTRDEKMYRVLEIARTIAPTKVPILITSESGCGKETLAKAVHIAGGRDRGRFVVASCSNLPANFFEMELFNAPRNDYHGSRPPESSSLALDEVGELDASMQLKLLRILKEQDVNKGTLRRGTAADARIIACSNKNLQDEVNAQRFRGEIQNAGRVSIAVQTGVGLSWPSH